MREEDAVYGGEMSAHHYFRDFAYCDSGMIPWLLVAELLAVKGETLSGLVSERMKAFPCSGEINFKVQNAHKIIEKITDLYASKAVKRDETDGISLEFYTWRMNIRTSNTEPLLRLNIESRKESVLVNDMLEKISLLIKAPQ
ncbi:Phosphoglucosamine mutase [Pantoea agglomerans]|uniref:Phosphoglucosamine mutase n=2 Tax=Enterobacter agglomerans TaxID=549 RepID=A0A379AEL3_ENTAG|nr:Phosphoglucosamine mutase [Pantoea agglomerans]